ncbi:hypothetical protein [Acidisphaera sp. L21]|uniref:hypothetical protein n=1 Tax=Acidisphaera sp. L21 TaxID=1641851 RepID=UPI00131AE77D|nr:hypothetical protein [Acidisphaera sp. L21]
MARVAKVSKSTKSATPVRKPARPTTAAASKPATTVVSTPTKRSKAVAPTEKRKPGRPAKAAVIAPTIAAKATKTTARAPAPPPAPKVCKDELRAQVEKLELTVTTLRAKSREANKAAKASTARIAELEDQVAQLEKKLASATAPVRQAALPKAPRAKRQAREIDPGDAVPPGVAVQEPAPLDEEAKSVLENLEHLGHE